MRVCMTTGGSADTWVEADEQADEVWSDGVGEFVHEVGIRAWRGVTRRSFTLLERRGDRR